MEATGRRNSRIAEELETGSEPGIGPAVVIARRLCLQAVVAEIPHGHTTRSTVAELLTEIAQLPTGLAELRAAILSPIVKLAPGNSWGARVEISLAAGRVELVETVPLGLALAIVRGLARAAARMEEGRTASGAVTSHEVAAETEMLLAEAQEDTAEQVLALLAAEALPALVVLVVAGLVVAAVADGDNRNGTRKSGMGALGARS